MSYTYVTKNSSPNNSGPRTLYGVDKPEFIVIHHWGKRGQKFNSVVRFLCTLWSKRSDKRKSSANYVAQAGTVACIIDPDNVAWHCGDWEANTKSIGIECRPEATDDDYETVAELIRDLREEYGPLPLRPHNEFQATACPGIWDLPRLDRMARDIADEPRDERPEKTTKGMARWMMRRTGGSIKGESLTTILRRIDKNVKRLADLYGKEDGK